MAITVKHKKVSAIADDPSAVAAGQVVPSDWNDDHNLVGLGTAAEAETTDFATAAQGALADTAVQPGDLGTAAFADATAFATAAQGAKADSAVQPGDLGTAAAADTADFATAAQGVLADSALQPGSNAAIATIGYVIDGGGAAITTGTLKNSLRIPFACTINSVTVLADQTGSIVVDIWKDTFANYPPTVADSICASAKPTLSSAVKSEDTTLTGWTTSVAAGDVLLFNVDSAATVQNVTIILKVTKT